MTQCALSSLSDSQRQSTCSLFKCVSPGLRWCPKWTQGEGEGSSSWVSLRQSWGGRWAGEEGRGLTCCQRFEAVSVLFQGRFRSKEEMKAALPPGC